MSATIAEITARAVEAVEAIRAEERADMEPVIKAAMRVVEASRIWLHGSDGVPNPDELPDDEWDPTALGIRDAIAAYDAAIEERRQR